MTLLRSIRTTSLLPLFYFPRPRLVRSCPHLPSSPPPFSFWTRIFSSCHRGKQNTVAVETARRVERGEESREASLWDIQSGDRSLYMAISCLRAGRPGSTLLWTLRLSFLCDLRDRWSDRQTEWDGERKTYGVWSAWYWSLDLAAAVLLLLACPAFCAPPPRPLHNNTQHTHCS